jgi:hypothetical protein
MHASDRTLLQKLGFDDSDRKRPEHDGACRYLAYVAAERIWQSIYPDYTKEMHAWLADLRTRDPENAKHYDLRGRTEVHITKGKWEYKQTVGFADVILSCFVASKGNDGRLSFHRETIVIEVKTQPVQTSDAMRQLRVYGSFIENCDKLALATTYELPGAERFQLSRENIVHLQLGEDFQKWFDADQCSECAPASITI